MLVRAMFPSQKLSLEEGGDSSSRPCIFALKVEPAHPCSGAEQAVKVSPKVAPGSDGGFATCCRLQGCNISSRSRLGPDAEKLQRGGSYNALGLRETFANPNHGIKVGWGGTLQEGELVRGSLSTKACFSS